MRKVHVFGLALLAMFAFSSIAAGAAFAESEILLEGKPIPAGTIVKSSGELLLTDLTSLGEATVHCSGILVGEAKSATDLLIFEVQNLAEEGTSTTPLTGLGLSCEGLNLCTGTSTVWAENLPWLAEVFLEGTKFRVHLTEHEGSGLFPAYDVTCKTVIGGEVSDLCEGLVTGTLENMVEGLLAVFILTEQEELEEQATCTFTGGKTGHLEGEGLIVALLNGGTVTDPLEVS